MKRVLVTGGRSYSAVHRVFAELDAIHRDHGIAVVIHGAANGADALAARWASARGVPVESCPADWVTYGKSAGHRRNAEMLKNHCPDLVVAFPGGRGTADMVRRAGIAKVTVVMVRA